MNNIYSLNDLNSYKLNSNSVSFTGFSLPQPKHQASLSSIIKSLKINKSYFKKKLHLKHLPVCILRTLFGILARLFSSQIFRTDLIAFSTSFRKDADMF